MLEKIRPLVNIGFGNISGTQTPMNRAMSVNLLEAIAGEYPDLIIDPESFIYSVDDLSGAENPAMAAKRGTPALVSPRLSGAFPG